MPTDPCYYPSFKNCLKEKSPINGFECCVETPPNNVKSRLGLWVREGTCNRKTGHCKSDSAPKLPDLTENYATQKRENYEDDNCKDNCKDDCKGKNTFLIIGFFLLFIVAFILLSRVI